MDAISLLQVNKPARPIVHVLGTWAEVILAVAILVFKMTKNKMAAKMDHLMAMII